MENNEKPFVGIVFQIEPYQLYYMLYDTGTGNKEKTSNCLAVIFKDIDDNLYEFDQNEGFRKFEPKYFIKNILKLELASFHNETLNYYFNKNTFSYILHKNDESSEDLYSIVIRNDMDGRQNLKVFIAHLNNVSEHHPREFNIYNPTSKTWTKVYETFSEDHADILMWFKLKDLKRKYSDDELKIFKVDLSSRALLNPLDDKNINIDWIDWKDEVKNDEQETVKS